MRMRRLGRTGLEVSEVGFGGAGIGHAWGATSDEEAVRAVRRALDLGVTFFDTSPVYGAGRSEDNIGRGLAGARAGVVLATKVRIASEAELGDVEAVIRRSLEASLERLRTDHVDILQIHHQVGPARSQYVANPGPPPRMALRLAHDDAMAVADAAAALVGEGRVRFLGLTAWDGDGQVVERLMASGAFATAQILYNLVNQSAAGPPPPGFDDIDQGGALVAARRHDVGVIAIRSHAAGALVASLDREVAPDSDVARDFARARSLDFLSARAGSLAAAATRFCLDRLDVATVVPGVKSVCEIEEAVAAASLPPLSPDDYAIILSLYARQFAS